jgi:hypothetical protein
MDTKEHESPTKIRAANSNLTRKLQARVRLHSREDALPTLAVQKAADAAINRISAQK